MKKIILLILLIALTSCSPNPAKELDEEIFFVVTSDNHAFAPTLVEDQQLFNDEITHRGDGRQLNYVSEITTAFIDEMIELKPEFVIITGDLTLNGEKDSHIWLAEQLEKLKKNHIQPLVIPGNHDIMNPYSHSYAKKPEYVSTISAEQFATIYENAGYKDALYRDPNSLSYIYPLRDNAWMLMLDTAMYQDNSSLGPVGSGKIRSETFDWIEEKANEAKEKNIQIISATHHNIIQQNPMFDSDYTLLNTLKILRIFDEQDIRVNFSGHIHAQSINQKTKENGTITDIASSSLLVYTNQYGVIHYKPFDSLNYKTQELDIEQWASTHSDDDNLLNFEEYSKSFFEYSSTSRGSNRYENYPYSEERLKQLQDAKGLLNGYYFSGKINDIRDEFIQTEFYNWILEQDSYTRQYILTMLKDNGLNPSEISIPLNK